jgi:hypothetical protein
VEAQPATPEIDQEDELLDDLEIKAIIEGLYASMSYQNATEIEETKIIIKGLEASKSYAQ